MKQDETPIKKSQQENFSHTTRGKVGCGVNGTRHDQRPCVCVWLKCIYRPHPLTSGLLQYSCSPCDCPLPYL